MKIIRVAVQDNRPADDLPHPEPPGQHLQIGSSIISQQRRQVSGVLGMLCPARIEVTAGFGKTIPGTISARMDVKPKESGLCPWQA